MTARVIVDTSVWIDFFRGKLPAKQRDAFVVLLEADEVIITDIIKHELLVGARTEKDYRFLSDSLAALPELSIDPKKRMEVNRFGFELKMQGLVGKYTDLTIAYHSKINHYPIYSLDQYFVKLSRKNIVSLFEI